MVEHSKTCGICNQYFQDDYFHQYHCLLCKRLANSEIHIFENEQFCTQHDDRLILFCKELNCNKLICHGCFKNEHINHFCCGIKDHANACVDEFKHIADENNTKISNINFYIHQLQVKMRSLEESFIEIEKSLHERQTAFMEIVRNAFKAQFQEVSNRRKILQEFMDEVETMEKLKVQLLNEFKNFKHKSDFQVIRDYQDIKQLSSEKLQIRRDLLTSNCIDLTPQFNYEIARERIIELAGQVHNMDVDYYSNCKWVPSQMFSREHFSIDKISYDGKSCIFALQKCNKKLFILKLWNENIYKKVFIMNHDNDICCDLILLPNGNILIFIRTMWTGFFLQVSSCFKIPTVNFKLPFCEAKYINVICSNQLFHFLFFYSKSLHSIFKYNSNTKDFSRCNIEVDDSVLMMSVAEDLDTIALTDFKGIKLFSFSGERVLHTFGDKNDVYKSIVFLSTAIFLTYNCKLHRFEVVDATSGKMINSFKIFENPSSLAIVHCSSSSAFVLCTFTNEKCCKIFKISSL